MYHSFLIHSSADGHLGCFHVLAIINSAAMNTGVHVALSDLVSSVTHNILNQLQFINSLRVSFHGRFMLSGFHNLRFILCELIVLWCYKSIGSLPWVTLDMHGREVTLIESFTPGSRRGVALLRADISHLCDKRRMPFFWEGVTSVLCSAQGWDPWTWPEYVSLTLLADGYDRRGVFLKDRARWGCGLTNLALEKRGQGRDPSKLCCGERLGALFPGCKLWDFPPLKFWLMAHFPRRWCSKPSQ